VVGALATKTRVEDAMPASAPAAITHPPATCGEPVELGKGRPALAGREQRSSVPGLTQW